MSDMDELRQRLVSMAGAMRHAAESASLRGEWTAEIDLNALERWGKTLSAGAALLAQGQAPPGHVVVPFETAERIHACLHYQLSEHEALMPELTEADRVFTAALNAARAKVPPQGQAPPQGVTVEPLLRYAQAQAKCQCCGQSSECTPECTLADDDIEAWSAVDNARSVVAAALAEKGEAGGG